MKEARHKGLRIILFHLCENFQKRQSHRDRKQISGCLELEVEAGTDANRQGGTLWGNGMIPKLDGGDVYMPVYMCCTSECHSISFILQ